MAKARMWRGMAIAAGVALAASSAAFSSPVEAATTYALVNGPVPSNVRAGNDQAIFQFVRTDTAGGAPASGVTVHFDSVSGPNAGQHAAVVSGTSGEVIWRMSTTASAPNGGDDEVQAWIDLNGNGAFDAAEPRNTLTVHTLPSVNQPPLAGSVEIDLPANDTTQIRLGGLDPEGTRTGYAIVQGPQHGSVPPFLTGPAVLYTPNNGYVGDDTMTYRITDADGASADGQVLIHVRAQATDASGDSSCNGLTPTIVSNGTDVQGTGGNDVVLSLAANAVVSVRDGDDVVCAPNGAARIYTGNGNDRVFTGGGNTLIYSGDGDDNISVGDGANTVFAGNGNDVVATGAGADVVYAEGGDDAVNTGAGYSIVSGGPGNDRLTTGRDGGNLWGGDGDDVLTEPSRTWRS